jgi:hypothetical protein
MARGSVFLVNLAGLDLPEATLNEIEREIGRVVDTKVAGIAKLKGKVATAPIGPEIRGKYLIPAAAAAALGGKVLGG